VPRDAAEKRKEKRERLQDPLAAALLFKRHKWKDEHLILILTNGQETKTKYLLEFGLKKEYAENEDVSRQGKPRLVLKED
jgi:hypothetical protein